MSHVAQDLRIVLRRLRAEPGLSAVTILVIGAALALSTAVFSVFNGLLLRPLPYRDSAELVVVQEIHRTQGYGGSSWPNFRDWTRGVSAFSSTALLDVAPAKLTQLDGRELAEGPEEITVGRVTPSFLPMLGVRPAAGRWLHSDEEARGPDDTVVLSHGACRQWLGAGSEAIGRTVAFDGRRYTVVGVMPKGFHFNYGAKIVAWIPVASDATARDARRFATFARLAPGSTIEGAREQLRVVASRLAQEFPVSNASWTLAIAPLQHASDLVDPPTITALSLALAASLLVVTICGANVASLLLARATSRSRELAVRAALGSSRGQAVGTVLVESLSLSLLGTLTGLPLAYALRGAVAGIVPAYLDFGALLSFDAAALCFGVTTALVFGVLSGLAPALRAAAVRPAEALKDGATTTATRASQALSALVVVEFSLALILLVAAGLLLRTLAYLDSAPVGYRTRDVLTMALALPEDRDLAAVPHFYAELTSQATQVPGVLAAAVGESPPMSGMYTGAPVLRSGRPEPADPRTIRALRHSVTSGYFATLGIPIRSGRSFDARDVAHSEPVAILSEALVQRDWAGEDPLGRSVRVAGTWRTVVGVAGDVRHRGPLLERNERDVYVPQTQAPSRSVFFAVYGRDVARLAPSLCRLVGSLDPEVGVSHVRTMKTLLAEATAEQREITGWAVGFSAFALVLAFTGLFGTTSYWVAQRARELAVRRALGAGRAHVLWLVLGRTLLLASVGVATGVGSSLLLSRTVAALLHGVRELDLTTYAFAVLAVFATAMVAGAVPALRASRIPPGVVLRRS